MAKDSEVQIRVTQKVKVITPKGKYTNHPYQYAIPVSVKNRLPVTGQESIIGTPDKWTGKEKLTQSEKDKLQMGSSPYVINPEDPILIMHGYEYDNSFDSYISKDKDGNDKETARVYINPKDHAELTAILASSESPVAKSKLLYNHTKHQFYVDDKEQEAKVTIDDIDLAFEAESFVRNDIGIGRYGEILIFLGHAVPEYKVTPGNLSETRIKALVLDACRKYPKEVLKMKGPGSTRIIFVTKVINYGIIVRKKNNDFYYGDIFIGPTFDSVVEWMEDKRNNQIVSKWQMQLDVKEKRSKDEPIPELT